MTDVQKTDLKFGVEIELYACSEDKELEEFLQTTSETLTKKGVPSRVFLSDAQQPVDTYDKWTLKVESSLSEEEGKHGFEAATKIYELKDPWQKDVRTFYDIFKAADNTLASLNSYDEYSSTQVNVSPANGSWTTDRLQKLSRAILHFERNMDFLIPVERINNKYCKPNHMSVFFKCSSRENRPKLEDCKKVIASAQSELEIIELMCSLPKGWQYASVVEDYKEMRFKKLLLKDYMVDRRFTWNLTEAIEGRVTEGRTIEERSLEGRVIEERAKAKGTVEFRLPPGCVDAEGTLGWVYFTLGFVSAALAQDVNATVEAEGYPKEMEALQKFVRDGLELLDLGSEVLLESRKCVEQLFEDKLHKGHTKIYHSEDPLNWKILTSDEEDASDTPSP